MPQYSTYTVGSLVKAMEAKEYVVFDNEYDLNIVGVRSADLESNKFNDVICVFHHREADFWPLYTFQATTDPGQYWRDHPMNELGTANLVPGQYRRMWKLGKHKGYDALQQHSKVTVLRQPDGVLDTGLFYINLHRANAFKNSTQIDKWSAGCQVVADPDDFDFLMCLVDRQIEAGYGHTFTYTLLEERDLD